MLHGLAVAAQTSGGLFGSNGIFFLFVLLAFGALWLMSSRTRKQQRAQQEARNNLAPGDSVMTASGMFGTVVSAEGDVVVLETSPGVETRWVRAAITKKVDPPVVEPATPTALAASTGGDDADEFAVPDDLSSLDDGTLDDGTDDDGTTREDRPRS